MNCPKHHLELKLIRIENKNGVFVKIMECPNCKNLTPVLPSKDEMEEFNGGS